MEAFRAAMAPIHREGYRFVALFAVATLLLFWLYTPLGWVGVLATVWCAYFFRDPSRVTPVGEGLVISPADGVVQSIETVPPPVELAMGDRPRTRISVFMNVLNVHVNRVPVSGDISALAYVPGKFLNASLDKASDDNERQAIRIATADGKDIAMVQIAGLIARRILCDLFDGQGVRAGERFGMIRFGSRVDVYLDEGHIVRVAVGQLAIGGETILADTRGDEPRREGEVR